MPVKQPRDFSPSGSSARHHATCSPCVQAEKTTPCLHRLLASVVRNPVQSKH